MSTFLFYDLETTGLDPVFDQILQFAAIRTDEALNPVAAPVNWFVRLRPDVIPSPGALLKTNRAVISLQDGRPEYEVLRDIWNLVNAPGTISIGHNSLDFDDKFLRFGFYRNLLPAYTHQFSDGCGRSDLLAILIRYRHFAPDALTWPELADGPTLKLEHLAPANGCDDGPAHDALADVCASLGIARRLRAFDAQWRDAIDSFSKDSDRTAAYSLPPLTSSDATSFRKGALLDKSCGRACLYAAPVLLAGESNQYRKKSYWLRLDDDRLTERLLADPSARVCRSKNWGEVPQVVHPARVALTPGQLEVARANVAWLEQHPDCLSRLRAYLWRYTYPPVENVDTDAAIYLRGFPDPGEAALHERFHAAPLPAKSDLIAQMCHPTDRALAHRLLWRNYGYCGEEPTGLRPLMDETGCKDYKGNWKRTRADALAEIDRLEADHAGDDDALAKLREMLGWLQGAPGGSASHKIAPYR